MSLSLLCEKCRTPIQVTDDQAGKCINCQHCGNITDTRSLQEFLAELGRETAWEWKWEKLNRIRGESTILATWIVRILMLTLAWFHWYQPTGAGALVSLFLAILAVLNIGLPLLAFQLRFQQRQEVHDKHAREYSAIKVEFDAGQLTLSEAVGNLTVTRRKPTEKVIRETA